MAFYYFKSGGTATGDSGRYLTAQTGSFATLGAANYYDNIKAAMNATTPPVSGDVGYGSHLHSHLYTANNAYVGSTSGEFIHWASVNDAAIDSYLAGASESASDGFDLSFTGRNTFTGIDLMSGDDIDITNQNTQVFVTNGSIGVDGGNDIVRIAGDGSALVLNNSDLSCAGFSASVDLSNGVYLEMNGGAVITDDRFMFSNWDSGGAKVKLTGVDLTQVSTYLLRFVGASPSTDDLLDVNLIGCSLSTSSPGFVEEEFTNLNHKFSTFNSSKTSAGAEYQFFVRTMQGDAADESDSGIHRNESTAFPSGTKVSIKTTTKSTTSKFNPLVIDLPSVFADLSSASSDTLRIYFAVANTTTLTDTNCWAELTYSDGTVKQQYNLASNRNADILSAGVTHTDDSGASTWKNGVVDLTGYNEYRMDVDTSANAGSDGVPIIKIYLAEPSVDVYFDTTVNVVA